MKPDMEKKIIEKKYKGKSTQDWFSGPKQVQELTYIVLQAKF